MIVACRSVAVLALAAAAVVPARAQELPPITSPAAVRAAAARTPPPVWRLPLGAVLIEDMQAIEAGRLLLVLREDAQDVSGLEHLLIAEDSGRVLWRRRSPKNGDLDAAAVLDDAILFHAKPGKEDELTLVALADGSERWKARLGGPNLQPITLPEAGRVIISRPGKKGVELVALSLESGRQAWKHPFADSGAGRPIIVDTVLLHSYGELTRLDPVSGAAMWTSSCRPKPDDAPPVSWGAALFIVCDSALVALDLATGGPRWSAKASGFTEITSLYVDADLLVVRGVADAKGREESGGVGNFLFVRLDPATGARRWAVRTTTPTVSNMIRANGRLIAATPRAVIGLDEETGRLIFEREVDQIGRPYPVRLRGYPDRVVFIGELTVAAVDPDSGRLLYRHGLTPISQETSLTQLDALIPRLESQVAAHAPRKTGPLPDAGGIALAEASRFQQLSNTWRAQEDIYRMRGDAGMRDFAAGQSARASRQAERMNNIAMAASLIQIGLIFYFKHKQRAAAAVWEGFLRREMLFRRTIVAANQLGLEGDYLVRPEMTAGGGDAAFTSLVVIDLRTGQRRTTPASPAYQSYGLWNRFDPSRRIVFHQGIGLDPDAWKWSEPRPLWPHRKARTIETFLLAVPVRVP